MIKIVVHLLRIRHWVKNTLLFAPLFFASRFSFADFLLVAQGFVAFSFLASAMYIINDIVDVQSDRRHLRKRFRPIASGSISPRAAFSVAIVLFAGAIGLSAPLATSFQFVLWSYGALGILYTTILKKMMFVDVFSIAVGFVLRVAAGSMVIGVAVSHWIIVITFFGSLFLGFTKRIHEEGYCSSRLLQQLLTITATLTIASYVFYTIDDDTVRRFGTDMLFVTIVFVIFGVFSYLRIVDDESLSGDPTKVMLTSRMIAIIAAWLVSFFAIVTLNGAFR